MGGKRIKNQSEEYSPPPNELHEDLLEERRLQLKAAIERIDHNDANNNPVNNENIAVDCAEVEETNVNENNELENQNMCRCLLETGSYYTQTLTLI